MMKKIMMIMVILLVFSSKSQTKNKDDDIEISFNIYLDNKKTETDSVQVKFVSKNNKSLYVYPTYITDSFITYFKPNRVYNMVISHPKYNNQIVKINTYKIKNKTINVYLNKS
jgi:hypothetical protein